MWPATEPGETGSPEPWISIAGLSALLLAGVLFVIPPADAGHEPGSGSAPSANFTVAPAEALTGEPFAFTDTSQDPDGDLSSWRFAFGDGIEVESGDTYRRSKQNHRYADDGNYTVRLTVTDEAGHTDTAERTLMVRNRPPTAGMDIDPMQATPGEPVRFEDRSSDRDGRIVARNWSFGDGTRARDAAPEHVFERAGKYTVELTVVDDDGASARTSRQINVTQAPADGQSVGRLQALVDAAGANSTLRLPEGVYEESVRIAKPLDLVAEGTVVVNGGAETAFLIEDARVRLENLRLRSTGPAIRVEQAPRVDLWNVSVDAPAPAITAEETGWVTIVQPVGEPHPVVEASDSWVLHAHPVDVRVERPDRTPAADVQVRIQDGGGVLLNRSSSADGSLPTIAVAHRWQRGVSGGLNETLAHLPGGETASVDPHAGTVILSTDAPGSTSTGVSGTALAASIAVVTMGAAAAVAWTQERFRWWIWPLIAPLYSRLNRSELLEHETREAIHAHLSENPGSHLRAIGRALDLPHGTLLHHLHVLEDRDLVRSQKDGMYRRFYLVGEAPDDPGHPGLDQRIEDLIQQQPGVTNAQIADELDVTPSRSHYHVRQLLDAERIRREPDGREVHLYPSDEPGRSDVEDERPE